MNIISPSLTIVAGQVPRAYPLPTVFPGIGEQAAYVAVCNAGPSDVQVAVGAMSAVNATNGILVPASSYGTAPGTLRSTLSIGPFVAVDASTGALWISAVTVPSQVVAAVTNGTAGNDSTSLTVDSASGIAVGQTVSASAGIATGTIVNSIDGTNVTLSLPTTAALTEAEVQFSALPTVQPPTVVICALGF